MVNRHNESRPKSVNRVLTNSLFLLNFMGGRTRKHLVSQNKGPARAGPHFPQGERKTYRTEVQSCAGGSATPIFVFNDGEVLKSNMSSRVFAC